MKARDRERAGALRMIVDVLQQDGDETRFILVEVYRDEGAPARHKETAHYQQWRDAVAPMMASPRTSVRLANVFPADDAW